MVLKFQAILLHLQTGRARLLSRPGRRPLRSAKHDRKLMESLEQTSRLESKSFLTFASLTNLWTIKPFTLREFRVLFTLHGASLSSRLRAVTKWWRHKILTLPVFFLFILPFSYIMPT